VIVLALEGEFIEEVMNATMKSSGASHWANTKQGLRFKLVRSVKGNAAWTISPGRNIRSLFAEAGVLAAGKNIEIAVDFGLFFEKIECAALLRQL